MDQKILKESLHLSLKHYKTIRSDIVDEKNQREAEYKQAERQFKAHVKELEDIESKIKNIEDQINLLKSP